MKFIKNADEEIVILGIEYTSIVTIFSFGLMMQSIVERLLSSTGKTNGSMVVLLFGATTIKPAILQSETHLYHQSQEMQGLDEKRFANY